MGCDTNRSESRRPVAAACCGSATDVIDSDGVWNVARVLSVPSPGEVGENRVLTVCLRLLRGDEKTSQGGDWLRGARCR
jgi:hypothetical protein